MPDITKIKIGNERERSYKDFPANREFKKRAEDDNPGGGGWPADLPKPSVGGYGYTEQVEQTVVDNESVTTVDDGDYIYGQFSTPFDIVEGAYTVIFNGTEYNLNSAFDEERDAYYLGEVTETGPDFSRYPFYIANDGGDTYLYTESAGDYEVTVKKSSDTIHKIDEKYLPSGAIFVTTEENGDSQYIASMSSNEIYEAAMSGNAVYLKVRHRVIALNNVFKHNLDTSAVFADIGSNVEGTLFMPTVYQIEGTDVYEHLFSIDA